VESEEGTGTTFMIALPLVPQERPPAGLAPGGGA